MFRPRNRLLILCVLGALIWPPGAAAQPADDVTALLTSFSSSTAPDRPLVVTLAVTNSGTTSVEEVAIRLTIHERVRNRSALTQALDREPQGEVLAVTTEELNEPLAPDETRIVTIQRDLGSLATAFAAGRGGSGVYPLTIRVTVGERTVIDRSGAFVFLATAPETKLNVVWVMPIHRATAADSTGAYNRTQLNRELLAGGTIRGMVEILERHPAAALTLAPSGLLADQLFDISNGFDARAEGGGRTPVPASDPIALAAGELLARLRTAFASPAFEVATAPYARADLTTLVGADMLLDARQQVAGGQVTVARHLGRRPDPAVFVNANYRADVRSARTLAALGAKILVLDPAILRDRPEGRFGHPDRPEEVRGSGQSFDALLIDGPTRNRLQSPPEDPVLTAMGVLAEAAITFFEVPGVAPARTIVLGTDTMPSPAIAGPLLDALALSPWALLRTASGAVNDPVLRPAAEPLRLKTFDVDTSERLLLARAARRTLDVLERVVEAPDVLAELDRRILVAESADFAGGNARRTAAAVAYARSARATAEGTLRAITVPPRRVTFTSRRGPRVPVTVVNQTGFPIVVRVHLDSAKVTFHNGSSRRVEIEANEPGGKTLSTVTFDLEARTAGSFPINVRIETTDGEDVIGAGQLLVRSTAVSTVALAATAGGALFLLVAWGRRAFVRRPKAKANG